MNAPRRVIRRSEIERNEGFDAQLWPVLVALCVFCGVAFGTILTFLRGPWLWASLLTLPIAAAIGAYALGMVSNRWIRRSLQFGILTSLAIHLLLLMSAFHTGIFGEKEVAQRQRPRTLQRRTIRRPVDFPTDNWTDVNPVDIPDPDQTPIETQREVETSPERPQPVPVDQPQPVAQPNLERRPESDRTPPRQQESLSELSRQTARDLPQSSAQADVARTSDVPERSASAAEAESQVAPERMAAAAPDRTSIESPTPQPAATATRREVSSETATSETQLAQSPAERPDPAAATSTAAAQTNAPAMAQSSATPSAQPSVSQIARADATASPQGRTSVPEPDPVSNPTAQPERRTSNEAEPQAVLARSNTSTPDTPRATARPDLADRADTAVASQAPTPNLEATAAAGGAASAATEASRSRDSRATPDSQVAPVAAAAARRSAAGAAESASALAASSAPRREAAAELPIETAAESTAALSAQRVATTPAASPTETNVRQRTTEAERPSQTRPAENATAAVLPQVPRATRSESAATAASAIPTAPASDSPRRSLASAAQAASPTNVETPAVAATGSGPVTPAAEASPLAMTQAEQGTAGRGRSPNLESDSPASERPALQASNSARRERSTRADEAGEALASSTQVSDARSRAQAAAPSSTVAAETTANSPISGAQELQSEVATAGAASTTASAAVTAGDVSALQGSSEVDLGPIKVVSESGVGRGSGGGSPELSSNPTMLEDGSSPRAGQAASIAASTMADVPAAPLADGGGEPTLVDGQAEALASDAATGAMDQTRSPTSGDRADSASFELAGPVPADAALAASRRTTDGTEGESGPAELAAATGRQGSGAGPATDASAETSSVADGMSDEEEEEEARRLAAAGATGPSGADAPAAPRRAAGSPGDPPADSEELGGLAEAAGPSRRGRSESATAAPGALALGGGDRARRSASLPATDTGAEVTLGSMSEPGSQGTTGPTADAGAVAGGGEAVGPSSAAGGGAAVRRAEVGPDLLAGGTETGLPSRRSRAGLTEGAGSLPATSSGRTGTDAGGPAVTPVDLGQVAGGSGGGAAATPDGDANDQMAGEAVATARTVTGGVRVEINAAEGAGGLGTEFASEPGVNDRRARPDEGPLQNVVDSRFRRRDSGGAPTMNTAAAVATEAYADRERGRSGREGGPQTEESIENGLAFLIRFQEPEGHWRLERYGNGLGDETDETALTRSDTAATGLSLLAFQGAGYNHLEYRYAEPMRRAVTWLVENQDENGDLYVESDSESSNYSRLYSHSIAALALCEAYGITQDPTLKEPAQKALDYIVASQDPRLGGWRYIPNRGSDTSVTGWMMMAMKSGRLAGLKVENEPFDKIIIWLTQAADSNQPGEYRYNPYADGSERQSHGRVVSPSMTAVGLLMRLYLGDDRNHPELRRGAQSLLESLPSDSDSRVRDTYYWYYATQVLRHVDGEAWQTWAGSLRPLLLETQVTQGEYAGSWDPLMPVPDRWSLHGGRLYLTTMNLLSLEVDYRLLPLYDDTVK